MRVENNLFGIIIEFLTLSNIFPVWAGLHMMSESFLGVKFNCRASESFFLKLVGKYCCCSSVL